MAKKENKYNRNKEIENIIADVMEEHKRTGRPVKLDPDTLNLCLQYCGDGGNKNADIIKGGALNEFYTPDYICDIMYRLAKYHGYKRGKILEPSAGIGNMLKSFVDANDVDSITIYETNEYSCEICQSRYYEQTIEAHNDFFETAFLEPPRFCSCRKSVKPEFDLVIGNPPYGKHTNKYTSFFKKEDDFKQTETFFIKKGLDSLKSGGLLIFIVPMNVLANDIDTLKSIPNLCIIEDAYRLPPVFGSTNICTDIIVLRKR